MKVPSSVCSVLDGAIFGDHCSPISDTTVLSSLSTGCDHLDHVNTQLVYALTTMMGAASLGFSVRKVQKSGFLTQRASLPANDSQISLISAV